MRHIPYKSNLCKWNKNIVSHTYTHAQQHMSKYQIERNKVVARDKCLRANDLSLLFFNIFHHFFFHGLCFSCLALLHSHSIHFIRSFLIGAFAIRKLLQFLHIFHGWSCCYCCCWCCFSSLCPVTQYSSSSIDWIELEKYNTANSECAELKVVILLLLLLFFPFYSWFSLNQFDFFSSNNSMLLFILLAYHYKATKSVSVMNEDK